MKEMDRRGALGLLLGGVILAGAGVSLWPENAEALSESLPTDPAAAAAATREPDAGKLAQAGSPSPTSRPPHRPPHRPPPPRPRRRRRWVCWWHGRRRRCGWRWR